MNLSHAIIHILFIGNSLTYVNDVPNIVREIAELDGVEVNVTSVAYPDFSLDDHIANGSLEMLKDQKFDFLIAQQGPSALPESQVLLKQSAIKFSQLCSSHRIRFGLYGVWPSQARSFDRDACIDSYASAAEASNALLCPAGLAWKLAWEKDPKLPLYGPDQFHAGIHGSVLAAMTIYAAIQGKKDLDFIKKSKWPSISKAQLDVMKSAAIRSLNGL